MRFAILMIIAVSAPFVQAQDFENQMKSLLEKREKAIAEIDKKFYEEFLAIREAAIKSQKVKFEASMKSLDLENSKLIKAQMEQLTTLEPKYNKRNLFINDRKSKDEHLRFFVKCVEGIWLEFGEAQNNTIAVWLKETSVSPDYVEIAHENGFVYRLYDDKTMYKNSEMKTFKLGYKGRWLADVEIDFPKDSLPVKQQ